MRPVSQVLPPAEATVVQMLAAAAQAAPRGEALVAGERRLDYAGYLAGVAGFARELQALGAQGGRVATLMGNSIDACIAALATLAAGAQQVPLNPLYTAYELAAILEGAEPTVLVADAALAEMAGPVARRAGVAHLIVVGDGARRLDAWRPGETDLPPPPAPDSLALLQYTGGTTGRPKGVELTHGAIAVNVAQREALLPTRRRDRVLCMTPLSHAYAMAMGLFLSLHCAGTLVILPRYQPDEVLAAVARERIGVFLGTPTIFTGLLAHPGFATASWRTVHTCYSGSSALPVVTLERWRDAVGAPVHEGYGQTEAGPVLSFNPVPGPVRPGTVGVPVPLTEIEIVDVETGLQVLPPGACGEIRVRGPQVMRGYRKRPEETAQALRGGWLYTGDIGAFDADGYLSIRDRKKDMVIVGGYNVYPREVEEVLFAHPDVADAAVVGRPDAYRGEALVAHVVPRPGAPPDADALLAHCRERLARYKIPAEWRFSHALPKTAANKTDKNALRRT
ncbi:long-chain fatty acid--CoA ligase [Ramlibacter monticola]|uniref:AMP-binding protein n=1 Tax=Ramlibacter monticola TaxID=1926872 RepID=A0A937CRV8_9BURK|nr:AMP-binding protein [Ramlibacter monticola]MBL0389808.1 AMP-binding protein [Ramlibacter monticola]